jgi:uncharacterized membrane protein
MQLVILTAVTGLVFLVADAIMLSSVIKPLFQKHLGEGLLDGLRLPAAILFYVLYLFGMVWFAGLPGLREGVGTAALNGALLGLVAYGTYELTSWAVMKNWHPAMVATDLAWGTVLTAGSVTAGVLAARLLA